VLASRLILLIMMLALSVAPLRSAVAQTFQTSAPFALLVDYESGAVLFEKNADDLMGPASTTKLMTAEIVFHEIKARDASSSTTSFEVSENAWRTGGAHSHGSAMFLEVHSRVHIEDLIRGLVIQSGNDAAITLAEGIAGTEDQLRRHDEQAAPRELGMTRSTFRQFLGQERSERSA
jgi:D-alanyl-D-alanine carboxypeptidase (penicillin-binding protein 5/6)